MHHSDNVQFYTDELNDRVGQRMKPGTARCSVPREIHCQTSLGNTSKRAMVSLLRKPQNSQRQTRKQQQKEDKSTVIVSRANTMSQPSARPEHSKDAQLAKELKKEIGSSHSPAAAGTAAGLTMSDSVIESIDKKQKCGVHSNSSTRSLLNTCEMSKSDLSWAAATSSPKPSDAAADVKIYKSLLTGNIYVEKTCPQKAKATGAKGKDGSKLCIASKKEEFGSIVTPTESRMGDILDTALKTVVCSTIKDSGTATQTLAKAGACHPIGHKIFSGPVAISASKQTDCKGYALPEVHAVHSIKIEPEDFIDEKVVHKGLEMTKKLPAEKGKNTAEFGDNIENTVSRAVGTGPRPLGVNTKSSAASDRCSQDSEFPNSEIDMKLTSAPCLKTVQRKDQGKPHTPKKSSKMCSNRGHQVKQSDGPDGQVKAEKAASRRLYRSLLSGTLTEMSCEPSASSHTHPTVISGRSAVKGGGIISDQEDMKDAMLSLIQQKQWNSSLRQFTYLDHSQQSQTAFTFHLEGQGDESEIKYVDVLRCGGASVGGASDVGSRCGGAGDVRNSPTELVGYKVMNSPSSETKPKLGESVLGSSKSSSHSSPRKRPIPGCGMMPIKPKTSKLELICQNLWKAKTSDQEMNKQSHSKTLDNTSTCCRNWRCTSKKRNVKKKSREKYVAMREKKSFNSTSVCWSVHPGTGEIIEEDQDNTTKIGDVCGHTAETSGNEQPIDLSINKAQLCCEVPFASYH